MSPTARGGAESGLSPAVAALQNLGQGQTTVRTAAQRLPSTARGGAGPQNILRLPPSGGAGTALRSVMRPHHLGEWKGVAGALAPPSLSAHCAYNIDRPRQKTCTMGGVSKFARPPKNQAARARLIPRTGWARPQVAGSARLRKWLPIQPCKPALFCEKRLWLGGNRLDLAKIGPRRPKGANIATNSHAAPSGRYSAHL